MSKKYGNVPEDIAKTLAERWIKAGLKGSGWLNCVSWVKWAYANGYQKGFHLGKFDETKPHGPDNSFFYNVARKLPEGEQREEAVSQLCRECKNVCPGHGNGCAAWQKWWVENWNRNICRKPRKRVNPYIRERKREFFRYEHPDLEREGIE